MPTTETIRVAYSAELQNWSLSRVRNKPEWVAEVGVLLAEFTDGPLQRRVMVAAACDAANALMLTDVEIVSDDWDRAQGGSAPVRLERCPRIA